MNIKKNQKPTEYDIHLKYECPKCSNVHWLSFLEASTKNFKVVCDCKTVFMVKRVRAFKIKYAEETLDKNLSKKSSSPQTEKESLIDVPENVLNQAIPVLEEYGFTLKECKDLIVKAYQKQKTNNILELIKYILETLEYEKSYS